MSNAPRKPIIRITAANRDKQKFSVASVWAGNFPGSYSISLDKGSANYPAMGFLDALKAWAAGQLYINIIVESQTEQRGNGGGGYGGGRQSSAQQDDWSSNDDGNIPF